MVITIVVLSRRGDGQVRLSGSEANVTFASKMWKEIWNEDAGRTNNAAPAQLAVFADFQCLACRGFDGTVLPRMKERFADRLPATRILAVSLPSGGSHRRERFKV